MRISELARRGGVPVGTVKFYLREGLVPPGRRTAATQAEYDDTHVDRLRLVRVLLGTGELTVAAVRQVVAALERPRPDDDLLRTVHRALAAPTTAEVVTPAERDRAAALVRRWGWDVEADSPGLDQLAAAVGGLAAAGLTEVDADLDRYAEAAAALADADVDSVPAGPPDAAVRHVVTGTVLYEPVLLVLRRLAQENAARRRS